MKDALANSVAERDEARAERDRYRDVLLKKLVRDAAAEAIRRFGGRSKALNWIIEEQLAVREIGTKFRVVVVKPLRRGAARGIVVGFAHGAATLCRLRWCIRCKS